MNLLFVFLLLPLTVYSMNPEPIALTSICHKDLQNVEDAPSCHHQFLKNLAIDLKKKTVLAKDESPVSSLYTSELQPFFEKLTWKTKTIHIYDKNHHQIGIILFKHYNKPHLLQKIIPCGETKEKDDYDGYIYELFVEKNYRNKGIGSFLFKQAIAMMEKHHCKKIMWWAGDPLNQLKQDQKRLESFYIKLGGQKIEHQNDHENYFIYRPHQQINKETTPG